MPDTPKKRRPQGSGSVDKLPSGKFRVRVSVNGRRITELCTTLEEAEALRRALNNQVRAVVQVEGSKPAVETLCSYGEEFLDRREKSGNHRAIDTERGLWRTHIATAKFAQSPLRSITRVEVRDWLEDLERKHPATPNRKGNKSLRLSWSRRRQALVLLRVCLQDAVDRERINENPAANLRVKKAARSDDEWTFLSLEEIERVRSCEKIPEEGRLLCTIAIHTGLRQGELWGLHRRDVHTDGERPHLVVRHSHAGPTKSGKVRMVPLLASAVAAFNRWFELHDLSGEDLVFTTVRGCRRRRRDDAGWSSRKINGKPRVGFRELAGIEPRGVRTVHFHDLRHTCASHLVMGSWGRTWSLLEVAKFLGHSTTTMTERYAHLAEDHLHRSARETFGVTYTARSQTPVPVGHEGVHGETKKAGNLSDSPAFSPSRGDWIRTSDSQTPSLVGKVVVSSGSKPCDPSVTHEASPADLAVRVLRAVAKGIDPGEAANALVVNVLRSSAPGSKGWMLALSVLEGETHRATRAVDLAELVLDEAPARGKSEAG